MAGIFQGVLLALCWHKAFPHNEHSSFKKNVRCMPWEDRLEVFYHGEIQRHTRSFSSLMFCIFHNAIMFLFILKYINIYHIYKYTYLYIIHPKNLNITGKV